MEKNKNLIWKIGALVIILGIAVWMFIIGRGHTVYFDNKSMEYEGKEIPALYKISVYVNGESMGSIKEKERAMATTMGQPFSFDIKVQESKESEKVDHHFDITLPYDLDGIVLNIPGMLAGVPSEAYSSEFVSLATTVDTGEEEEIVTDEFQMGDF